jgi:hypothetical protein
MKVRSAVTVRVAASSSGPLHESEIANVGVEPGSDESERLLDVATETAQVVLWIDGCERHPDIRRLDFCIQAYNHRVLDRDQIRAIPAAVRRAAPDRKSRPEAFCHMTLFEGFSHPQVASSSDLSHISSDESAGRAGALHSGAGRSTILAHGSDSGPDTRGRASARSRLQPVARSFVAGVGACERHADRTFASYPRRPRRGCVLVVRPVSSLS